MDDDFVIVALALEAATFLEVERVMGKPVGNARFFLIYWMLISDLACWDSMCRGLIPPQTPQSLLQVDQSPNLTNPTKPSE
jgi:hypothetical protein